MTRRNHRNVGLSSRISGERQRGHRDAQSPRVLKEVGSDPYPLEKFSPEMASSGPVPHDIGRLGVFGGLFHRTRRVVASRLPPCTRRGNPLRVVPRVQPWRCGR